MVTIIIIHIRLNIRFHSQIKVLIIINKLNIGVNSDMKGKITNIEYLSEFWVKHVKVF